MTDFIASLIALAGAAFLALAALALHRMPDIYGRLSATSKAVTLGATMLLGAAAVHAMDGGVTARAIAGIAFLLLTSPVAGHVLGRAAWRSGMEAKVAHLDEFMTGPDVRDEASAEVLVAEETEAAEVGADVETAADDDEEHD